MDNLRMLIKNLFGNISPNEILKGNVTYDKIKPETFFKLNNAYVGRYSNDEVNNMYYYLENEFEWQHHRLLGEMPLRRDVDTSLNVFDPLMTFVCTVLLEENNEPVCRYQHLLRWRDVTGELEEDLFTTAFMAMRDCLSDNARYHFFWKPIIGHNNFALNKLVSRGVAENHFHLGGSAPMFHLSWISAMNHINKPEFERVFQKYDKDKLQKNISYDVTYAYDTFVVMWRQAALLRLFLFTVLKNDYIDFENTYVTVDYLGRFLNEEEMRCLEEWEEKQCEKQAAESCTNMKRKFVLEKFLEEEGQKIDKERIDKIKLLFAEKMVRKMLESHQLLEENIVLIQNNIDRMKDNYGKSCYDYTLCHRWLRHNPVDGKNEIISGERWFMYSFFKGAYKKDKFLAPYLNWFYLYLILKSNIRKEIIQINERVGFDNFQRYQDRKTDLITGTEFEEVFIRMAVRDTINNQHIKKLEARIKPKNSRMAMKETIKKLDDYICEGMDKKKRKKFLKKYFYVLHFIKNSETKKEGECRHYQKRNEIKEQAMALHELRKAGDKESRRIFGIDACSAEIGCRPEVFAQTFRFLSNNSAEQTFRNGLITDGLIENNNLMISYHAGEDFLDVIDGLRAIDEAVLFLNMKCGDRLGHALALGIDIDEWYETKANRILISKQDYLDNLVWLYGKIRKYNIDDCGEVVLYIEKRFSELFNAIYINNITPDIYRGINERAAEHFNKKNMMHGYQKNYFQCGINDYYDAWKLRGDNPELYKDGYFDSEKLMWDEWNFYAMNREYPLNYRIRYNPEAAVLYYMYHYSQGVYDIGKQIIEVKINPCVKRAVKKVQYIMQRKIAGIGIGIEVNPTSNYEIGTFKRYDKHPITDWYNQGLVYDPRELQRCPQMQVSINTDDQGVFSTYIENEYAYMALALEKCKDENGNCIYNRSCILEWLENIRKMGFAQTFDL